MFGPKIRNVFKSRWQAVFWSLGVLSTAYCTVPVADQTEQAAEKRQVAKHANPWAKPTGTPGQHGPG